ncbi:Transcriptional regulator MraZ [Paraconexibacter sp. AEG42_29]|uniref:Transcriptional regulator MraZ n=1 Tax=Paraconexibacter sp. AEG42_29 TaxID=2997339 RepID=A0AAU7AVC0_9ACTN
MATFRGTFDYTLDAKNRLTVPAKWRPSLADGIVLSKSTAKCISVWTPERFDAYTETAVSQLHELDQRRDKLERYYQANSHDVDLDAAGRIMIPAFLLEHAGLSKEVVITGVRSRMEIWDKATWQAYNAELDIEELTAPFTSNVVPFPGTPS